MADRYDRAECATELNLRNTVLQRVESCWRTARAFGIPADRASDGGDSQCESSSAGETSETSSGRIGEQRDNDIADFSTVPPLPR